MSILMAYGRMDVSTCIYMTEKKKEKKIKFKICNILMFTFFEYKLRILFKKPIRNDVEKRIQ